MEFEALIAALHKTIQRRLSWPARRSPTPSAYSASQRSIASNFEARKALIEPARNQGVTFEADAVDEIMTYTEGYPYFIQEYGSVAWNLADGTPIKSGDVRLAREAVEAKLDESFFRVRADRTTDAELRYLRAMAEIGSSPQLAGDVAGVLGRKSTSLGPTRARLIEKGLLWTPSHGYAAFTVPHFDRYMKRT